MNSRTHENFAKMMYPGYTYRKIQTVNSIIDNPSKRSKLFAEALNFVNTMQTTGKNKGKVTRKYTGGLDFLGLGNIPHRRVNHDPIGARIMSMIEFGPDAIPLTDLHLRLDVLSEAIKANYGRAYRDLIEAELNMVLESMLKRSRRPSNFHL